LFDFSLSLFPNRPFFGYCCRIENPQEKMEENPQDPPQGDPSQRDHTKGDNVEQETPITEVIAQEFHSQQSQYQETLTPHHSPMPHRPMNQFPQSNHMTTNTQQMTTFTEEEVFVGDLSYFCTEADLQQFFASIGEVLDVRIRWSHEVRELGHSLMHGFVTFRTAEEAHRAVAEKNGELYMGRNIRYVHS
jgi:RNA recognition motif-containing protein